MRSADAAVGRTQSIFSQIGAVLVSRSIPAYLWLGLAYVGFVLVVKFMSIGPDGAPADERALNLLIEDALEIPLFPIPLFSGIEFWVTWTVVFITFGLVCAWIEVLRALDIRNTGRNDTWSLIVTLAAFVLFVGVSAFGTTAFLIVALVGFGDVLLDRQVGQAVARRDFGGFGD